MIITLQATSKRPLQNSALLISPYLTLSFPSHLDSLNPYVRKYEVGALERLEAYVLKYRQSYNIIVKRYRASEDDDERKQRKAIVKETQGKLREAMQALSTASGLRGVSQMVKNDGKIQRGLDKGKGRILDDVNANRWPAAEKEASLKKKLDKWKGRAVNVGGQVEEPKRTKEEQEEEGQHLQKVHMEISPSAQEPIYEILMDENVVGNGAMSTHPSRIATLAINVFRASIVQLSSGGIKRLIKETLIEAKWAQVLYLASFP